jgi:putative sterol carrier protein
MAGAAVGCRPMPHFTDEQDVYARLGKLLQEIVGDDQIGSRLQRADTIFQCRLREPEARLTIKALAAEDREVALGQTTLQPEVIVSMDADTAHAFWLGELNPALALARGDIQTRGPAAKILRLVPLVVPVAARYRAQLEGSGGPEDAPEEQEADAEAQGEAPEAGPKAEDVPETEGEAPEAGPEADGEAPEAAPETEGEAPEAGPEAEGEAPEAAPEAEAPTRADAETPADDAQ